ncbi:hypothetical protein B0H19DRAFT_682485 [Mycena capillaripes]|nr:hypothetical protein B0H19DRAFT_682485 [Mycena capillaripes]
MGGDHKCPVCQATFTRPQHVARHMRSHTGDRPYKCTHCGDQFARSDLLSRHVNKCHAAEKALLAGGGAGAAGVGGGGPGRRKGTTAATRATTSKQACDQCVQSSLPCDGSNPCAKCVARKTRCTFVKFHRQTAPVGPGHPSSLSASSLPSSSSHPSLPPSSALPGLHAPLSHPTLSLDGSGGGGGQFLYAQQQSSGAGGFAPTFSATEQRFAHPADGRFLHGERGSPTYGGGERIRDGLTLRDYPPYYEYEYADSEHSGASVGGSVSGGSRPASSAGVGDYGAPYLNGHDLRQHPDLHQHPHAHHPAGDLHTHSHHPNDLRPPEFSSAFGLMSLDDPNVLAGLASDGVPFFSTAGQGRTGLTPGAGPLHDGMKAGGGAGRGSMQLVPPAALAFQAYSPPSSAHSHSASSSSASSGHMSQHHMSASLSGVGGSAMTPGSREAETRELREFWKAYMRTPLTGPSGADALGLQTPSAAASSAAAALGGLLGATPTRESVAAGGGNGNGNGRRYRVASLPSVKTPEGEMDAAPVYPVHAHPHHAQHQHQQQQHQQGQQQLAPPGRTMHNADDLRSYEAAVLARKAPELVLRKPARRPTTSSGVQQQHAQQQHQQQQQQHAGQPPIFEFGAAGRERGGAGALDGAGSQTQSSSLAGAFGFGQGYAAAPASSASHNNNSGPNSPFPGTPGSGASASASASASEDGDGDASSGEGSEALRPAFKRLPSQTLGPPQTKRRRDRTGQGLGLGGGLAPLTLAPPGGQQQSPPPSAPPTVNAYPDRPMIALRAPPPGALPQRRARRLSAPASPTGAAFGVN